MALSGDLRKRVVEAVVSGGLSRNAAAKRFEAGIASAVRWVKGPPLEELIEAAGAELRYLPPL